MFTVLLYYSTDWNKQLYLLWKAWQYCVKIVSYISRIFHIQNVIAQLSGYVTFLINLYTGNKSYVDGKRFTCLNIIKLLTPHLVGLSEVLKS